MYGLKTESSFDAAHFLTDYHGKCENLHGHRWRVVAYLEQEDLQSEGTMKVFHPSLHVSGCAR